MAVLPVRMLALVDEHVDFPFKLEGAILEVLDVLHGCGKQGVVRAVELFQLFL